MILRLARPVIVKTIASDDRKQVLNENKYVAAILLSLLKAFDYLPHGLLFLELKAHGVSENATQLLKN